MKTTITKQNLSESKVEEALKNPQGIIMSDVPEVREAVAKKMDDILTELHKNKS